MMRRLNLLITVLAALIIPLGGLLTAAPAAAYNVGAVYKDCENNGQLTGQYSRAELQAALNQLPAQVSEYSACADVIRQALVRASSHSGGHGGNSTPGGTAAGGGKNGGGPGGPGHAGSKGHGGKAGSSLSKRGKSVGAGGSANAVTLASGVRPGGTGSAGSSLPVPLIVVLVLLALTAVSGGAVAIRRRVVARHGT